MKRCILVALTAYVLISCQSKQKKTQDNKPAQSKSKVQKISGHAKLSKPDAKTIARQLQGIWILKGAGDQNANFAFEGSTIYYPEPDTRYPYKIAGDSIFITYDEGYIQRIKYTIQGNDTLTLLTTEHGANTFLRVKDRK